MTKNERIKKIREYYCSDVNKEFAEKMQTNPNATTNWVRNGYSVGDGVLYKILEKFPQINKDWLFEDKGEMLKNKNIGYTIHGDNGSIKGNIKVIEQLEQASVIISQLEQRLKDKETIIELLKKQINIYEQKN